MLEVDDVVVRYGGVVLALDRVSLDVPAGGAVALLGANGAGKTTLLRAIGGLLGYHRGAIVNGEIRFDGQSTRNWIPPASSRVASRRRSRVAACSPS